MVCDVGHKMSWFQDADCRHYHRKVGLLSHFRPNVKKLRLLNWSIEVYSVALMILAISLAIKPRVVVALA